MEKEKIANLKSMNEEELDKIASGGIPETSNDSRLLYEYGLVEDWHKTEHTTFYWKSDSAKVDEGWSKAGITCVTKPFADNKYFAGDKEISRTEAIKIVKEKFPKIRNT